MAWLPTPGGTFRATVAASTSLPQGSAAGNWIEFDLTGLTQEWVDGVTPNLGLILRNATAMSDELRFTTLNGDLSRAAQLVVTYR